MTHVFGLFVFVVCLSFVTAQVPVSEMTGQWGTKCIEVSGFKIPLLKTSLYLRTELDFSTVPTQLGEVRITAYTDKQCSKALVDGIIVSTHWVDQVFPTYTTVDFTWDRILVKPFGMAALFLNTLCPQPSPFQDGERTQIVSNCKIMGFPDFSNCKTLYGTLRLEAETPPDPRILKWAPFFRFGQKTLDCTAKTRSTNILDTFPFYYKGGPVAPPPTPAPVFTPVPTPVAPDPTPIAPIPTPVEIAPTPIVIAPTPLIEAPTPVVEAPTPLVEAPTPVMVAPTPVIEAPTPVVAPTPVIEAPTPVVAPTPPVKAPTPPVKAPTPPVKAPTPVTTSAPTPPFVLECASDPKPCPATGGHVYRENYPVCSFPACPGVNPSKTCMACGCPGVSCSNQIASYGSTNLINYEEWFMIGAFCMFIVFLFLYLQKHYRYIHQMELQEGLHDTHLRNDTDWVDDVQNHPLENSDSDGECRKSNEDLAKSPDFVDEENGDSNVDANGEKIGIDDDGTQSLRSVRLSSVSSNRADTKPRMSVMQSLIRQGSIALGLTQDTSRKSSIKNSKQGMYGRVKGSIAIGVGPSDSGRSNNPKDNFSRFARRANTDRTWNASHDDAHKNVYHKPVALTPDGVPIVSRPISKSRIEEKRNYRMNPSLLISKDAQQQAGNQNKAIAALNEFKKQYNDDSKEDVAEVDDESDNEQ